MLINFRIAYRTLLKNQVFSYINILGLAIGIAAFMFIVQYVRFERSYESFHKNANNILRLTTEFYNGSEYVTTDCETYAPLGPLLKDKFPEVIDFTRMYGMDGLVNVRAGTKNFLESGLYWADHSVFDVFTYEIVAGQVEKALATPFEVVLTESIAKKYFGRTDVVDQLIDIDSHSFRIKGVIADLPPNTHLKFSFLLSRLSFPVVKPWYPDDKWNNNNEFTYLLTVPGTDLAAFNEKLTTLTKSELKDVVSNKRFVAEPIKSIHLYSDKSYEPEPGGSAEAVYYLTIIAVFVIVIAWVNYVNLSTAKVVERAREVGIRKVMGSMRRQLIGQFLVESFLINAVSALLALIIFQLAFPHFTELTGQPLTLHLMDDEMVWIMLLTLTFAGSLLSGLYPALVLSSFSPASILKGKLLTSSHGQLLRKGLVIFQFSATVVLIICMATIYVQVQFMRNQSLGMNIDQTLVLTGKQLNLPDSIFKLTSGTLKNELKKDPSVKSVGRGQSLPGVDLQEVSTTSVNRLGAETENDGYLYYYYGIDAEYLSTIDIAFVAGRDFQEGHDNQDQVIINEEAVKMLGFSDAEEAVGAKVTFRTRGEADGSTIIGVLKNFHFRSPKESHLPMLFYYAEPATYFAVKATSNNMSETVRNAQRAWNKIYPGVVFNYFFLDEKYDHQYTADAKFGSVIATFTALVIIIACLGLFGLALYTTTQRTKEIGIRKVLGASVLQIVRLLSIQFISTVIIAAMIAIPIAYFAMERWLSQYYIRISLNAGIFIFAVGVIVVLVILTVSFQTIRTARSNPADSLRQE